MNRDFSQMSTPPPNGPPSGYGAPPPIYGAPPPRNNATQIVFIVLGVVFGGGIFIIAILAAILFPVFQKVRGNVRLSACLSNVRQIELGLTVYTQDHNGSFPPSAVQYKSAILAGMNDAPAFEQAFHCPADEGGGADYSMNKNLQGVNVDKIRQPRLVVSVYEGKNQILDFRHDGKAVVGFVDGHDRALTRVEAQELQWNP